MGIRVYKPTSAGRRNASVNLNEEVTKKSPEKSLLSPRPRKGGRNSQGKITNPNKDSQRERLQAEGITPVNGRVSLRTYQWQP